MGISNITQIYTDSNYSYALKEDKLYSWGAGLSFVLGTGNEDDKEIPVKTQIDFPLI